MTLFLTAVVARRVRRLLELYFLRQMPVETGTQRAGAVLTQYGLRVVGSTNDNISVIVPNSEFINGKVINWSLGDPEVRIHAPVGVAHGSDLATVTKALLAAARE